MDIHAKRILKVLLTLITLLIVSFILVVILLIRNDVSASDLYANLYHLNSLL